MEYREKKGDLIRAVDAEALVIGALVYFIGAQRVSNVFLDSLGVRMVLS